MDLFSALFGKPVTKITAREAQKRLSQKSKPILLDVRQPAEFRSGHIPGAKLIPLGDLSSRMDELPKNQEIICVCHSGNRSLSATRKLASAGYQVTNLQGGMIAWMRSGLPVSGGKR